MRGQRFVFGEVAELYDQARPGYSEQLVDDVLGYAAAGEVTLRALEVGAGTGKATVAFAARGLEILALEPSPEMAAVAARNCARFPGVRIVHSTFEDWPVEPAGFGLVISAQAWHWVGPAVRYVKAAEALAPSGALALFWHRVRWSGEPLHDELDRLYRRLVPELHPRNPGFPGLQPLAEDATRPDEISGSRLFGEVTKLSYPWSVTLSAEQLVARLSTQSDHRLLDSATRARLFDGVRRLAATCGDEVVIPHSTLLVLARRRRG